MLLESCAAFFWHLLSAFSFPRSVLSLLRLFLTLHNDYNKLRRSHLLFLYPSGAHLVERAATAAASPSVGARLRRC
ncbi:hypothetical protein V5799_016619 [Amblyomma americanum]|uniref:Uncharacterized protein n=1 Tax=Amblyomma americanum TaxID=6943 RepID=A0AAQ4F4L5_AMBAM